MEFGFTPYNAETNRRLFQTHVLLELGLTRLVQQVIWPQNTNIRLNSSLILFTLL